MEKPSQETKNEWHSNPNNWKWGVFYYNKNDERLLPPKKIKYFGLTINFANPYSVQFFIFSLFAGVAVGTVISKLITN